DNLNLCTDFELQSERWSNCKNVLKRVRRGELHFRRDFRAGNSSITAFAVIRIIQHFNDLPCLGIFKTFPCSLPVSGSRISEVSIAPAFTYQCNYQNHPPDQ